MKSLLFVLGLAVLIVLALAVTCPDEASFGRYLDSQEAPEDASIVDRASESLLRSQERLSADYSDKVLWAIVETTRGTHRERYVGVLGTWINTSGDEDD